eukprot:TRINITY_DN5387_c0_g1_i2.p1 TRINITY_DN5387_c0_g1~~TRINITY_DN5387_c0_g1_i2.p1  ORF type:complete len:284 (-),score=102.51 TRINITY_DN5387_c0_g1_i2:237-1088(-)
MCIRDRYQRRVRGHTEPMASFKIGALLLKQLTKPFAQRIKKSAADHPWFKERCIAFAQVSNRLQVNISRNLMGHADKDAKIVPLTESRAIENGANLLSELVVFSVAGGLIVYEYGRKARSDGMKALREEARQLEVATALAELKEDCALLRLMITEQGIANAQRHVAAVVPVAAKPQVQGNLLEDMWSYFSGGNRAVERERIEAHKLELQKRQDEARIQKEKHEQAVVERVQRRRAQAENKKKISVQEAEDNKKNGQIFLEDTDETGRTSVKEKLAAFKSRFEE